ncbi:unnamed protein product [Auanema sp. JU1783]|nr:unnamed protein product [Auanema sp. JU1783]
MNRELYEHLISTSSSSASSTVDTRHPHRRNMGQLSLLFLKNAILMTRNYGWTFFELVLPILFTLPIIILVLNNQNSTMSPELSFGELTIRGNDKDTKENAGFSQAMFSTWCRREQVEIAYSTKESVDFADEIMREFEEHFKGSGFRIKATRFDSLKELQDVLMDNLEIQGICRFKRFVNGVYFSRLNRDDFIINYKIITPSHIGGVQDNWKLDTNWDEQYGQADQFYKMPLDPPYWKSGFLSFQKRLDMAFIKITQNVTIFDPVLHLERLPEPSYYISTLSYFLKFLPILWGLLSFLIVLHAAKDSAQEKTEIKDFLSVMGLSTPAFYLSHILFNYLKCLIIFLVCAVPLIRNIPEISNSLFLFVVCVYGYGVVTFGVFISSMFKTSNSTIKVTILVWMLSIGFAYKLPNKEMIMRSFFFSLNINGAFSMTINGMNDFLTRGEYLGWHNIFVGGHHWFTVGFGIIMIIVDIIWMSVLTLVFDKLLAGGDFSFMFHSNRSTDNIDGGRDTNSDANEVDTGLLTDGIEKISVDFLKKRWYRTGEVAVDNISLKTYAGQVTVLLGHNGAGKSTTFSMICGLVSPTAGSISICGANADFHTSRRNLGLCPQGNPLFEKLTVMEHLWLIHGLKGARTDYKVESKQLLDEIKLSEKAHELSRNLSGGMKRKLCVCMALIGGSEVVLLDEPTAGMDPGARRDVENILQKIKKDKSVLLTTHYMDEAELLGDRVFIMSKGKIVCSGSPGFLTKKYGVGYVMTVVTDELTNVDLTKEKILQAASDCSIFKAACSQSHGSQLEFTLPLESQTNFPLFFQSLENNQSMWGISSFGLSMTTLEQVFLKVGEETEKSSNDESVKQLYEKLVESQRDPRLHGVALIFSQFRAIIKKRILYSHRHWLQLLIQFVLPILILLGTRFMTTHNFNTVFGERDLSYNSIGPARVILLGSNNDELVDEYRRLVINAGDLLLHQVPDDVNDTLTLLRLPKTVPPIGFGAHLNEEDAKIFFNAKSPHSISAAINLLHNAYLHTFTNGIGSIGVSVSTYGKYADTSNLNEGEDILLAPVIVFALSLVTSSVVMFLVEERVCKFAHQQSLTGISPAAFWGFSFIYDTVLYAIMCTVFTCMFITYGWMEGYIIHVVMMWILYFWACVPFVYAVSFIMSSPSKANISLIIWQLFATLSAMLMVFTLSLLPNSPISTDMMNVIMSLLIFLLPSFALGNGFMALGSLSAKHVDPALVWEWNNLGRNYVFMIFFGLLSSITFLAFQFKSVRLSFFRIWEIRSGLRRIEQEPEEEDEDVARERNKIDDLVRRDELAMEVKDLTKYYGGFRALDHLSLGVSNGECFGLLGVNGAGKTTTFNILTGISFPSSGTAKIDNRDVSEQIAIGYCPQFDAVLMDLTGRETLVILAKLYGFSNPSMKADVVLRAVDLKEHGDKLARFYSGGQRRKLSIGLALMASTRMVILDEPTAGIDPKARRDIWDVLSVVRNLKESAMVLTSHSMDECEALCNRIAVLREGRMIAIGTSQHLKSRFGNNYTLTIVAPASDKKGIIIGKVNSEFPQSTLKTHANSASLTMKWQIARMPNDRWSSIFKKCQELADSVQAKDFCLAQSSLEETFLRLANYSSL